MRVEREVRVFAEDLTPPQSAPEDGILDSFSRIEVTSKSTLEERRILGDQSYS